MAEISDLKASFLRSSDYTFSLRPLKFVNKARLLPEQTSTSILLQKFSPYLNTEF